MRMCFDGRRRVQLRLWCPVCALHRHRMWVGDQRRLCQREDIGEVQHRWQDMQLRVWKCISPPRPRCFATVHPLLLTLECRHCACARACVVILCCRLLFSQCADPPSSWVPVSCPKLHPCVESQDCEYQGCSLGYCEQALGSSSGICMNSQGQVCVLKQSRVVVCMERSESISNVVLWCCCCIDPMRCWHSRALCSALSQAALSRAKAIRIASTRGVLVVFVIAGAAFARRGMDRFVSTTNAVLSLRCCTEPMRCWHSRARSSQCPPNTGNSAGNTGDSVGNTGDLTDESTAVPCRSVGAVGDADCRDAGCKCRDLACAGSCRATLKCENVDLTWVSFPGFVWERDSEREPKSDRKSGDACVCARESERHRERETLSARQEQGHERERKLMCGVLEGWRWHEMQ